MLYRTEFQDPNGNPQFMNCDELLTCMYANYDKPYIGKATFEGEKVVFSGMEVNNNFCSKVIVSPVYPRTVFFIEDVVKGCFDVHIFINEGCMDELPTVTLPAYVRNELIETVAGRY